MKAERLRYLRRHHPEHAAIAAGLAEVAAKTTIDAVAGNLAVTSAQSADSAA